MELLLIIIGGVLSAAIIFMIVDRVRNGPPNSADDEFIE